jgi:transcriptional regulator of acetoin/glycerol metabolism
MQPSAYPYDRQALKATWLQFAEQRIAPAAGSDPAVVRSWCCCREKGEIPSEPPHPDQHDAESLGQWRHVHSDLAAIARPFMEDIYKFAGESDMIVFLTDRELRPIEWLGDIELQRRLQQLGLTCRVQLSEEQIGTNAAAVALREGMPVQIVGPEHFFLTYHSLTDTAAPIHTPTGEVLGVIGTITPEANSHPHTLSVVMAVARAIENQVQADISLSEARRNLAELNIALQGMSRGILLLDSEGRITQINSQASDMLGIPHRLAVGRRLGALVGLPVEIEVAIAQQTPIEEKEVIFHGLKGPRPCLMAIDVLQEGPRLLGFVLTLEHAARVRRFAHRMVGTRAYFTFDDIVGRDPEIRRVLHYARTLAKSDSTVFLLGQSGTGKEMFAQAIHNASRRAHGPFVAINCGAMPRGLFATELFGDEGTPSTGAEGLPGKFELADGGTIFLDNVDGVPLDMQASLLRLIDTREVVRLGGTRAIPLNVRVIAASNNMSLTTEVHQGHFRADLFYRLTVLTLTIPPLKERGNDILLLIAHLMERFSQRLKRTVTVSPEALAVLQSYPWPGNVRELENVLEQAVLMGDGHELNLEHLPHGLRMATIGSTDEVVLTLQEAERHAIIRAGRVFQGNQTKMSNALGIGRTTLWRKMKALKLSRDSFVG